MTKCESAREINRVEKTLSPDYFLTASASDDSEAKSDKDPEIGSDDSDNFATADESESDIGSFARKCHVSAGRNLTLVRGGYG